MESQVLSQFLRSFWSPDFIKIFLTGFAILSLQLVCKYLTKAGVFRVSAPVDAKKQRDAHFDCLRLGLDLCLLGLLGVFGVFEVALRRGGHTPLNDIYAMQELMVIVQFVLIILALFFHIVFDSAEKSFKRGIFIPDIIGWVSIMASLGLFYLLSGGVF